jgi:hypothetical protein
LFVYSPQGQPFTVNLGKIAGSKVKGSWYDPRTGATQAFGEFKNSGTRQFTPPSSGPNNDWVLILDDTRKKYPAPTRVVTRKGA